MCVYILHLVHGVEGHLNVYSVVHVRVSNSAFSILQVVSDSEGEEESMDADQPETFVAHVPVPSQEEVSKSMYIQYRGSGMVMQQRWL